MRVEQHTDHVSRLGAYDPNVGGCEFDLWFSDATGRAPYPYQRALAKGRCLPARLEIPTGLGKTQAILAAWLWRRRFAEAALRTATPRRLVYCLPMRVLVTQTAAVARAFLENANVADIAVTVLMGGERDIPDGPSWDIQPECDAIVIGTQDMLLSRAMNRGYGMSRFRWPIPFALLNNDCLWVIDEPQLLGAGLASTAQLNAFRARRLGAHGPVHTLWLGATIDGAWLKTVDATAAEVNTVQSLTDDDYPLVARLRDAPKRLARGNCNPGDAKGLATAVLGEHRAGTRTLVIVNTVRRAREVFSHLRQLASPRKRSSRSAERTKSVGPQLVLLHSQFRSSDRVAREAEALADPGAEGTIVVSTQVVEAGVDITSSTLFTDVAPWASLVQRFGRCNRKGEDPEARIFWVDVKQKLSAKDALPYTPEDLADGKRGIEALGSNASLAAISAAGIPLRPLPLSQVIRLRDLVDLFDTTADLGGADIDVARFIRESQDRDVYFFWRSVTDDPGDEPSPQSLELCPVPIREAESWLELRSTGWRWNIVEGEWEPLRPDQLYPGVEVLVRASDGGYEPEVGWSAESRESVLPLPADRSNRDGSDKDEPLDRKRRAFETLIDHTNNVVERAERIGDAVGLSPTLLAVLLRSARLHDAGKAHAVFQETMEGPPGGPWAKSEKGRRHHSRPGFRHELASALMALENGEDDLVAYLIATHHGKVRVRIRANANEEGPPDGGPFAKGVWNGDKIDAVELGAGVVLPQTSMNLEYAFMGDSPSGESWTARAIRLRDHPDLGAFRLAYMEMLLRAADERASAGLP